MFVYGWVVYLLVIRRILDQDMFVSLLATFGLSLLMQQAINLKFGPEVQTIDMQLPVFDAFDSMVTIPSSKLLALGLAAFIAVCVVVFMKSSRGTGDKSNLKTLGRQECWALISTAYMHSLSPLIRCFVALLVSWFQSFL